EGGEVHLRDQHGVAHQALEPVEVDLRTVGGVVPDHGDPSTPGRADGGLEVGQCHRAASVAGGQHDGGARIGAGGTGNAGPAQADGLEGGAHHGQAVGCGDGPVHVRPGDEVTAVGDHHAVRGQQLGQAGGRGARVEPAVL